MSDAAHATVAPPPAPLAKTLSWRTIGALEHAVVELRGLVAEALVGKTVMTTGEDPRPAKVVDVDCLPSGRFACLISSDGLTRPMPFENLRPASAAPGETLD